MADVKKVLITLPESLLSEVDYLASMDNKNRSEFIREALPAGTQAPGITGAADSGIQRDGGYQCGHFRRVARGRKRGK